MKTVNIRGKNNVDEITKLLDDSFEPIRIGADKFDCAFISHKNQFDNIKIGDKLLFKVYKKNGFLVRDKILIVLI